MQIIAWTNKTKDRTMKHYTHQSKDNSKLSVKNSGITSLIQQHKTDIWREHLTLSIAMPPFADHPDNDIAPKVAYLDDDIAIKSCLLR